MAGFGVEGIRYFDQLRASGVAWADDLTYTFNRCNGFDQQLREAGHTRSFYWANNDCWEVDVRSSTFGGADNSWADNVDVFYIDTHGNNSSGNALLAYNVRHNEWIGSSANWRLGDNNAEWIFAYACHTVDLNNVLGLWDIYQRLHMFCGSWEDMYDGITTDECGEDVADNLTSGDLVSDAWIDGVSDWAVDNHPICVAAERESTWNGGQFDWPNTTIYRDHLWGHGETVSDIARADLFWLSWRWAEG